MIGLLKNIRVRAVLVFAAAFFGAVVCAGIIHAFELPKEYKKEVVLNPEDIPPPRIEPTVGPSIEERDELKKGGMYILSLDDCIRLALERNQRLKAAGYEVEASRKQELEANATFWPVLEYTYRIAPVPTDVDNAFNDFFDGNVTLFNSISTLIVFPVTTFGQIKTAQKMAAGGVEAAKTTRIKTRETTIFQIKQLYYGILFAKETIGLLNDAIRKIADKISDEEKKEEKEVSPYDILQLKGFKLDLERRREEADHNTQLAYEGLKIQLDLEPDAAIKLDVNYLKPVPDAPLTGENETIERAIEFLPEAKLIDVGVNVKRLQHRLEKLKLLPRVGFGFYFDLGRTTGFVANVVDTGAFTDPFNYTRAGIGLQFKGTIDFHGSYGRIKKAEAEYYKAAYEGTIARRALELDIRKAYLSVKRTKDDMQRAKSAESISNQMMFLSKMNKETGVGDDKEYSEALKYVLLTRGLYYKSVFDYNVAVADLEQKLGAADR